MRGKRLKITSLTYTPTPEKAYVAWTLGSKDLGKSPLQIPSLLLNFYRNMSITSPCVCITLTLILKAVICAWQCHVPIGRGDNLYLIKEEELVSTVDVTGTWEENYPHIYAVVISMTINFKQSSSTSPKVYGYLSGHISWFELQKNWLSNCVHSLLSILGRLLILKNLTQWLSQSRRSVNLFCEIHNEKLALGRGVWIWRCQPFQLSPLREARVREVYSLNLSSPFALG